MSTLEKLQNLLIRDYGLPREQLTPEAALDSLGVDSLGMMELLFEIEKTFGIAIPNEHVELRTVGQVVDYINRLVAAQGPLPRLAAQQ